MQFSRISIYHSITVQDGQKIIKHFLGEHKAITAEQQFLGLILWVFFAFKMAVAIVFLRENVVEAI